MRIVTCEACQTRYKIPSDKIKESGIKVRCSECKHEFHVFPEEEIIEKQDSYEEDIFDSESDENSGEINFDDDFLSEDKSSDSVNTDEQVGENFIPIEDIEKNYDFENSEKKDLTSNISVEPEPSDEELSLDFGDEETDVSDEELTLDFGDGEADVSDEELSLDFGDGETDVSDEELSLDFGDGETDVSDEELTLDFGDGETDVSDEELSLDFGEEELELDLKLTDETNLSEEDQELELESLEEELTLNLDFDSESEKSESPDEDFEEITLDLFSDEDENDLEVNIELEDEADLDQIDDEIELINDSTSTLAEASISDLQKDPHESENSDLASETPGDKNKEKSGLLVKLLIPLLIILSLIGGGYYAITKTDILDKAGINIPWLNNLKKTNYKDPGNLKIDAIVNEPRFLSTNNAGYLMILSGKVKNNYPYPVKKIKLKGELLFKDKKIASEKKFFAGNQLSDLKMKEMGTEEIEVELNKPFGDNRINSKIDPGKSIPFMVVFSKIPDDAGEISIEVISSEPVSNKN